MARFYGTIAYGEDIDKGNGVWELQITERTASGDVVRNTRRNDEGLKVNDDLSVSNLISIIADTYATEHFSAIRYVEWAGVKWRVTDVEVIHPRLLLRLGGKYNGPTPGDSGSP